MPFVILVCDDPWNVANSSCYFKMFFIFVKLLFDPKLSTDYELIVDGANDDFEKISLGWEALVKLLQIHLVSRWIELEWRIALVSVVFAFFVYRCQILISTEEISLSQPSEDYSVLRILHHNSIFFNGSLHSNLSWNHSLLSLKSTFFILNIDKSGIPFK